MSDSLWNLLVERNGGCRFPGCAIPPEMCDDHRAENWDDDGTPCRDNLARLC